jgi:MFS family permease
MLVFIEPGQPLVKVPDPVRIVEPMTNDEYPQRMERDWRHNMVVFVAWEFLWGFGMPFAMFGTLAPAYLGAMEAPKWLIGLVLSCPAVFAAAQIIIGHRTPARRRLAVFSIVTTGSIVPLLAYSAAALLWGDGWPQSLHWLLYVTAQVLFTGGCASVLSLYWEIMTDNIPPRRRGLLYGLRMVAVGGTGVAVGFAATRVLRWWPQPANFRLCFLIGTGIFLVSCVMLKFLRDHVNPLHAADAEHQRQPFLRYLASTLHAMGRRPGYRLAITLLILMALAAGGAPFIVDAAKDTLSATPEQQGVFSIVHLGATAALSWVLGAVADRRGYRRVSLLCAALLAAAFALCLAVPHITAWYVAWGLYAVVGMSMGMLLCNLSAELCPDIAPNRLVAVGNVLILVFILPSNALGGAVAGWCGSYTPVFAAYLVMSLAAAFGFAFLFRRPRKEGGEVS